MNGALGRFARLWAAAGISYLGDGVGLVAFPLLVASITRDPLLVAGATIAFDLPWLLFALPSGAVVDRVDRRLAMVSADSVRAVVVTVLALLVLPGNPPVWAIYVVAFTLSTAGTIFDPASEAIVPLVVGRDAVPSANSKLQATNWMCVYLVGPPVGAFLFQMVAPAIPFVLDGVSFVASALIVFSLSGAYAASRAAKGSIAGDVGEGVRWLIGHPVLRYTSSMAGLSNLATAAITATLVLFAQDVVGVSDLGYGLLLSCLGVGGLAGAAVAGRLITRLGSAGVLRLASCVGPPAALAMVALPAPIVVGLAGFAFGVSTAVWNVAHVSLRQQLVPDELRGRVSATNILIVWGTQPVGAVLGGAAATLFGLRAPIVLAAFVLSLQALVAFARVTPEAIDSARRMVEAPAPA